MRRTRILMVGGLVVATALVAYLLVFSVSASPKPITTGARVGQGPQIAFLKWNPSQQQGLVYSLDVAQGTVTQLTQSGSAQWFVWSPNGQYLALIVDRSLYVLDMTTGQLTSELPLGYTTEGPEWSPDSKFLAFGDKGNVYVTAVSGGTPRRLAQRGYNPRWSPDGTKVLFQESHQATSAADKSAYYLYTVNADGSDLQRLTAGINAEWSLNGEQIAFIGQDSTGNYNGGYVMNSDGSQIRLVKEDIDGLVRWLPDGQHLLLSHKNIVDTAVGSVNFFVTRIDGSDEIAIGQGHLVDWSRDGRRIAYIEYDFKRLCVFDLNTAKRDCSDDSGSGPQFSPDGSQISYVHIDGRNQTAICIRPVTLRGIRCYDDTSNGSFAYWRPEVGRK